MKRFLILLLCLTLLTGCRTVPQAPSSPETGTTEATLSTEQPGIPLLDQGEPAGASGNLLYIPNPHVESMACPELRLVGNSLLLYEHTFDGMLQMKRISLEDGSLLAEASWPMDPSVRVQVGSSLIGLCDNSGQVLILNESLEHERAYSVPLEGEGWYLDPEMETLYVFVFDRGLQSCDLKTGQTHWLLDNAAFVQSFGTKDGYTLFSYTDRADQKTYTGCLDLSASKVEMIPVQPPVCSGVRCGAQWLLRQDIASGVHVLVNHEKAVNFTLGEGMAELLPDRGHLLITDESYRELSLYEHDGAFRSRCSLPETEYASVGMDLIWSEGWQGYFFRDTYDHAAHLMFWDIGAEQEREALPVTPLGAAQAPAHILEEGLYQKAAELSQRFGVDIRIAEQCALEYSHYQADALTDPQSVRYALNVLELAFGSYPEGFLRQLPFGEIRQIRIELAENIRRQEQTDTHPKFANGFAQTVPGCYLIVFDSPSLGTQTVYHELSHVIDKRLAWDATLRPQALFSEEAWLSLQPEGFRYAESYTDLPDAAAAYENSGYFVRKYSMTFPTEDRATLMALIMSDKTLLQENPGMAEKMRYYAACIRDCFDTKGWPETTLWEWARD